MQVNRTKFERSGSLEYYSPDLYWENKTYKLKRSIERFHMTSRRPYWCSENNETAAMLVYQENPQGV